MYGCTYMYSISLRSLGLRRRANVEARDTVETQVGEIGDGVAIEPASFHTHLHVCVCLRAKDSRRETIWDDRLAQHVKNKEVIGWD